MDAHWKLLLEVDLDSAEDLPMKVKEYLLESAKKNRILEKNKKNRAIKYLWDQLRKYFDAFKII